MPLNLIRKRGDKEAQSWTASAPEGERIYAIGDIHGCLAPLAALMAKLEADRAAHPGVAARFVFLGDYVDRGQDSAGALDALVGFGARHDCVFLKGNHEAMMLRFMDGDDDMEAWLRNGGNETLSSYGVGAGAGPSATRAALRRAMPAAHERFLRGLRVSAARGDYFFAHAGVRPGVPLDAQSEADLLWIRGEFLNDERDHGKVVVHGHTPVDAPDLRRNRIGIDTGAVFAGPLTAVALTARDVRFIQATA
ncbi:MAG: metallophosphoesterase family protein [Hyphomicrobiales bacterium]|nr:metallophosphoesterase family protein [Hyphomicrobiales bacterium]